MVGHRVGSFRLVVGARVAPSENRETRLLTDRIGEMLRALTSVDRSVLVPLTALFGNIAAEIPAQVDVRADLVSASQILVVANGTANTSGRKSAPPKTNLGNNFLLDASAMGARATFRSHLSGDRTTGWVATIRDGASNFYPIGYSGGQGISGPNVCRLDLTTTQTVPVFVSVTLTATTNHLATVDIGADNTIEFIGSPGTTQREFPATVDATRGLKIRIMTGAAAQGGLPITFSGELEIRVRPRCDAVESATGCGSKPRLKIAPGFDDVIEFQLRDALPFTPTVLGFGTGRSPVLLPSLPALGPPCPLRIDAAVLLLGRTDRFGEWKTRIPVPSALKTMVEAQMVTVAPFGPAIDVRSTARFRVRCR